MRRSDSLFDLTGRTAVVTGASAGLGVTFARALSEQGANVVITARRADRLDALAKEISDAGGAVLALPCDVAHADQVEQVVAAAWDRFGRVDVMINNAGTAADGGPVPERLPRSLFEHTVQVNLLGVWYGCQAAGARMLADGRGGSIINVSSALGLGAQQNYPPAYQATKAAVINLSRALAASWGDRGVRVNVLAPGWFPSEMTDPYFSMPPFMRHILDGNPLGRVGDPDELIGPLLLLASDAGTYINGSTLVVDGGHTATFGASRHGDELVETIATVIPEGLGRRIVPETTPEAVPA
jgi:NAD(P)-dependent dehydrogenase (short-subunit alcohol dehydrogenase family)